MIPSLRNYLNESKTYLFTSNKNKLKEFQKALKGLDIVAKKGKDLPEVVADYITVSLYKSKDAGANTIIDDTILVVDGEEVVDIRWKLDDLKSGSKAEWITTIAHNDGKEINLYIGKVVGYIDTSKFVEDSFGFDSVFIPIGEQKTLTELGNKKDKYSARINALNKMKKGKSDIVKELSDLPNWTGRYQNK